jgi:hypothetical protein
VVVPPKWMSSHREINPRSIYGQANADVGSESGMAPLLVFPRTKKAIWTGPG